MSETVSYTSAVREMPEEERPRERLVECGPEALSTAELMAILFRSGTRELGAVALAQQVLHRFEDLRHLAQASLEQLQEVKGVGQVKAIELKAALELGKRLAVHTRSNTPIRTAQDVANLLMVRIKDYETEHFICLALNVKHMVLKVIEISQGGLDGTSAMPRDIYRAALREGAAAIIVCHNHPSGDPQPSRDDIAVTKKLVESGELIGVPLLDHIIFGDGRFVSMKERNLM